MYLAKVIGQVVATQKDDKLRGAGFGAASVAD